MNHVEELIDKWLADEITPEERHELARYAASDPQVARTLAALEQHDKTLAILRMGPAAPFDMAAAVLRRIHDEPPTQHTRAATQRSCEKIAEQAETGDVWPPRPRKTRVISGTGRRIFRGGQTSPVSARQVAVAGGPKSFFATKRPWSGTAIAAMALGLFIAGAGFGQLVGGFGSKKTDSAAVDAASAHAPFPAQDDRSANCETPSAVRFVFRAERAASVAIVGDFNDWNDRSHLLQRAADSDLWTTTVPLKKGMYEYMFVVDGTQWIADPLASRFRDDGFGNKNAVLEL